MAVALLGSYASNCASVQAITLGLGHKDTALAPRDVFQKCWFRVIDAASNMEERSDTECQAGSCVHIVNKCDAMPEKLLFSRHSDFGTLSVCTNFACTTHVDNFELQML